MAAAASIDCGKGTILAGGASSLRLEAADVCECCIPRFDDLEG